MSCSFLPWLRSLLVVLLASTATASAASVDCDTNGVVDEADVEAGLRVAIGIRPLVECASLDVDGNGLLSRRETVAAAPNPVMRRWWWRTVKNLPGEGDVLLRNAEVTSQYATWYWARPYQFKWAGCAAFVSHTVGFALVPSKPQVLQRRVTDSEALEQRPAGLGPIDILRVINTAVFHDIAWAHVAYLNGGLLEVEAGLAGVPHHELMLEGFREIDRGWQIRPSSDRRGSDAVWRGNALLLKHEQAGIIQDQLDHFTEPAGALVSRLVALDFDANNLSREEETTVSFQRSMRRHGRSDARVTNFADRWLWIEDEILPMWRRVDEEQPELLLRVDSLKRDRERWYKRAR
jgi:hypothetical protein